MLFLKPVHLFAIYVTNHPKLYQIRQQLQQRPSILLTGLQFPCSVLDGAISDTKRDEFSVRHNILKQFKTDAAKEEL